MPDAYQRLLLDSIHGDASLFARSDEVELAWGIIDPIIAAWDSPAAPQLCLYDTGFWGPTEATAWMSEQNREIILLKEIQGLHFKEIAEMLGLPVGTVKSRSNRARLELAREIQAMRAGAGA